MAKRNLWDWVARSNALAAHAERAVRVGRTLGINGWIQAATIALIIPAYAVVSRMLGHLSWWVAVPIALVTGTYALKLYAAVLTAMAVRGVKTIDLQQTGKDCIAFRDDVMEFMVERVDGAPSRFMGTGVPGSRMPEAMYAAWATSVDYNNRTRARAIQRFAHRAVALSHMLESIGAKPLNLWALENNMANVAIYVGAVGYLLERGLLSEARSMSPEEHRGVTVHLG